MTAANPVPAHSFLTNIEIPEIYYKDRVRHDWTRVRFGIVTCKICGVKINKNDKIYNLYCLDERLEIIECLKGVDYILNHQPTQIAPWYNFDKKFIMFDRKEWNEWINSIRSQLRRQE